jgi:uncharacterized protein YecA (UPF0149 family)
MSSGETSNETSTDEAEHACDDPGCGEHVHAAPFRREAPKTGRNDPCPCGSGKKFKKCCLGAAL